MVTSNTLELYIENIAAGGEGIARLDGKLIFVGQTAKGEKVRCRIVQEHKSWARAELVEVIEAAAERVQPACPLYGTCGGCDLQHLTYEAQLAAKIGILKDTFTRIGGFSPPEPKVFPSAPWEYRNRMQLHICPTGGLGMNARKSSEVIAVPDCPIADPGIRTFLQKAVQGEMPLPSIGKDRFTIYARAGLLLYEGGTEQGKTEIAGRSINLDASVFFQSNGAMLESLVTGLREIVAAETARIRSTQGGSAQGAALADLYGGVGTFAVFLGEYFSRIEILESSEKALALARENMAHSPGEWSQAEFFAIKDTDWVKLKRSGLDFVVADPPRTGLAPALAKWLAEKGPQLLAYVSCDPATLARDSAILRRTGGYELSELRFYDFYPQTAHVESLALFRK